MVRGRSKIPVVLGWGSVAEGKGQLMLSWAICRKSARPGALVSRFDLCHVTHATRGAAVACGISRPGDHELVAVKVDADRARLYRVVWSLSHTADGRLRTPE